MIPLNYHHLYYFWTVARAGSISAATERLYLSQPALSGQLKSLEKACKARLLERGRHGMTLTHEGRLVFDRCERIFSEGDELAAMIQAGFNAPAVLRLGVTAAVSREVVLELLAFAKKRDEECRVAVVTSSAENLAAKLRRQTVDLVISNEYRGRELGRDYATRLAGRLPIVFVAAPKFAKEKKSYPAVLAGLPLLLRSEENVVRRQVEQLLGRLHLRYRVEASSDDSELLRRLALSGRGVAALPAQAAQADVSAGKLKILNPRATGIFESVWLAWPVKPRANPGVLRMLEAVSSHFKPTGGARS